MNAIFDPKRIDNLRSELVQYVGKTVSVRCIGEADPDRYQGQSAFTIDGDGSGYWVPESDLRRIVSIVSR